MRKHISKQEGKQTNKQKQEGEGDEQTNKQKQTHTNR
jgi:hypothetical protein